MSRKRKPAVSLVRFLEERKVGGLTDIPRLTGALETFSVQEALTVIRMARRDRPALEALVAYSTRFKAGADEMTVEDVEEARDLLRVKKVMES